ncbi:hypothetical protein SAMN05421630_11522 [Prauserella marina]|uniref:Uncharacterized protein n=2 Tax=Prauserella marina TaxID=530584 RepID=A0A1G6YYY4_9PSEU|nr:hypothetical protein DES30_11290 [Prauserella marina]SDD95521.1 hypothetical protein SAMN05421630_11522 [Prauserella marina]
MGTAAQRPCARCKRSMAMTRNVARGGRAHKSRGLCAGCYVVVLRHGELELYPRLRRNRDEVLHEFQHLREQGIRSHRDLASALRMTEGALYNMLRRARLAGDPRAPD